MSSIMRVNMADLSVEIQPVPEQWAGYSGRALTSAIVFAEVPPNSDPLGPENKLVFAPGLFGGTQAPNGGRLSVGAKSPLTGGIKESNSGGQAALTLGRARIAAVVIEGAPEEPEARYVLQITSKAKGELVRMDELTGLGNYETAEKLREMTEGKKIATITNGPAGERMLKAACIAVSDPSDYPNRIAARGGLGAVMGSKGLKAITIGLGTGWVTPKDRAAFTAAAGRFKTALKKHPFSGKLLPKYGTDVLFKIVDAAGGATVRNFTKGDWRYADDVWGETAREIIEERRGKVKGHPCSTGCVINCSHYYVHHEGGGKYWTKGPEYDSVAALGAVCELHNLDDISELDYRCADFGLDTIETGTALAMYMEAGKAPFEDGYNSLKSFDQIVEGTDDGNAMGNGAEAAGQAFEVERIPVVKHQAISGFDPRAVQGMGVTFASSPMGADDSAGYAITANLLNIGGKVNPLKPAGQARLSKDLQILTAMLDSMGLCLFVIFAVLDNPDALKAIWEMASALTGDKWDAERLTRLGKEVLTMESLYNQAAGFTAADDRLPEFFYTEALPPHNTVYSVSDADVASVLDFVPATAKAMGIQAPSAAKKAAMKAAKKTAKAK